MDIGTAIKTVRTLRGLKQTDLCSAYLPDCRALWFLITILDLGDGGLRYADQYAQVSSL